MQHYWSKVEDIAEWNLKDYIQKGYNVLYCYHRKQYGSHYIQGTQENGWNSRTEYYESGPGEMRFIVGITKVAEQLYEK